MSAISTPEGEPEPSQKINWAMVFFGTAVILVSILLIFLLSRDSQLAKDQHIVVIMLLLTTPAGLAIIFKALGDSANFKNSDWSLRGAVAVWLLGLGVEYQIKDYIFPQNVENKISANLTLTVKNSS